MKNQFTAISITVIALLLSFSACNKEEEPEKDPFIVGLNNDNTQITEYSTPIEMFSQPYGELTEKFDLIGNESNDIKFISEHPISAFGFDIQSSHLYLLSEEVEFAVTTDNETTYKCKETYSETLIKYTNYFPASLYHCTGSEEIITNEVSHPKIFNEGEGIDNVTFSPVVDLFFASHNTSTFLGEEGGIPMQNSYDKHSGIWNDISDKYIVYRFSSGGSTLYGWIKLSIYDIKGIKIHEMGRQKS